MKPIRSLVLVCAALSLVACGDADLSIELPAQREGTETDALLRLDFPAGQSVEHRLPFRVSGGVPPYESIIEGCPDWVTLLPDQGILAGVAPVSERGRTFFCAYRVTDSGGFLEPQSVSYGLRIAVGSPAEFVGLTLPGPGKIDLSIGTYLGVALPAAMGGVEPYTYSFTCAGGALPPGTGFAPATRMFAGTPQGRFRDSCTYTATDSSQPAATVSVAVEIEVAGAAVESLALPELVVDLGGNNRIALTVERRYSVELAAASGGVAPYTYDLQCALPRGLGFSPDSRTLSGTPLEIFRGPDCTYTVTDSDSPPASVSRDIALTVDPLDRGNWRFRTRSLPRSDHPLNRTTGDVQTFATLPHAIPQTGAGTTERYSLPDIRRPLAFDHASRELSYTHTGVDPLFDTPTTFRYEVSVGGKVQDALCVDVSYRDPPPRLDSPSDGFLSTVRISIRDDAFLDRDGEYRCPDTTAPAPQSAARNVSNPVHTALAPVHARRAVDVAHAAVRDRVRGRSPGAPNRLAISPSVDFASLSGRSAGFDYTGSSRSLSGGVEFGAGSWQAGLVAAFTRTDLRYRADPGLSGSGYRAGEHDTEIFSVHPFAAWHAPSGEKLWASLGAGLGDLRHRDDPGFPSWSASDIRLRAWTLGASVPVADILSGGLDAEAGFESFAFEIEGGGRISSALPTMRGRDYRAGLAWAAPVRGAPSLSVAYRQSTGDGPEGARLETRGSVSFAGILHPRLGATGSAGASFGLGDREHESWRLGGGIRFAPGEFGRGLGLDLETRLIPPAGGGSAGIGLRGEAGYGLWGGNLFRTVRPYAGLVRRSGGDAVRRSLGVGIGATPSPRLRLEVYDDPAGRSRGIALTWRRRF
ncbi:MAG: Ig domain-containing protein [Defluviicoccus sp.]|nr:Ig domain-containing protein [Defluviicoccus sp.]MDE0383742.1 Ig domain-containing protein [Defluviicoccus sp.]